MIPGELILLLSAALLALPETSWGQKSSDAGSYWRVCRLASGLPEPACVSVTLAPQGKILFRHLNSGSVSQLDGYAVNIIPSPGPAGGRVYQSPGGQLWTVVADGLQEFKNGNWVRHPVPEIAAEFRAQPPRMVNPIPLCPARQGFVLILLPDHLLQFNAEDPDHPRTEILIAAASTQLGHFSNMTLARDGGLWITGSRGILKVPGPVRNLGPETEWRQHLPPESLQLQGFQEPHEDEAGVVTLLTEASTGRGMTLVHFDGQHWTVEAVPIQAAQRAWCAAEGTRWAMTGNSLMEWETGAPEAVNAGQGFARQYHDVAVERDGTFWLATSDGLIRYALLTWRTPNLVRTLNAPVPCLTGNGESRLWFFSDTKLHLLEDDRHQEYSLPIMIPGAQSVAPALFPLKDGMLVFEAAGQCWQFEPGKGVFSPVRREPSAGPVKALGLLRDGRLCVQAPGGDASRQGSRLEIYDGARFAPLAVPPPEPSPGSAISTLFTAQNGDLWVSGEHGTAWYHEQKWRPFISNDGSSPASVVSFAEQVDGRLWCATQDKIWAFDGRNWSAMRVGLDHINALAGTRDGSLWVATESGLHRFFQGAWTENGTEEGLPGAAVRDLYEDPRGRLWAATANGLSLYHPEADPDPPHTEAKALPGKGQRIPQGGTITLSFTAQDKWNYSPRQRLLYSCRLDGREWSAFQEERSVSFTDLPAGKHYFQVRAMDRNGNVDLAPSRLEFSVVPPWYRESRPVIIALLGLTVALFFAGLAFNRHRQLLRSYAEVEKKVAQRTRELELANRQLLHSQKMNALGTLAAGIAHDFNNILSIIEGSAQIIEDNVDNSTKVRTRVDRIKTVVEQGAGIVKAMLGFSRDAGEQPSSCDVNAVLEDTVKLLGDRFLREAQITLERAPDLPKVPCSKDLVQQVVLNFLFNAAESMPQRKQIILATRQVTELPAGLVLSPAPARQYAAVSVRDFGCGISPENLPRIFEPFFTTKAMSARRGTGLGLSMVYELAKKMGAGLAVASAVDHGSTFTLILPALQNTTDEHA